MNHESAEPGWSWFDGVAPEDEDDVLPRAFARCITGNDGDLVIRHLRQAFLERRLPPQAGDAALWHLEGQRAAAAHILAMVDRGRH
jgi:hypothetical protein